MGNEDHRQAHLARQSREQIDDLRLDRDVQRRNGLVRDDEPRPHRERAGNRDALPLPAGELVRIFAAEARGKADTVEQRRDFCGKFCA